MYSMSSTSTKMYSMKQQKKSKNVFTWNSSTRTRMYSMEQQKKKNKNVFHEQHKHKNVFHGTAKEEQECIHMEQQHKNKDVFHGTAKEEEQECFRSHFRSISLLKPPSFLYFRRKYSLIPDISGVTSQPFHSFNRLYFKGKYSSICRDNTEVF